jgi:hypothetical protein
VTESTRVLAPRPIKQIAAEAVSDIDRALALLEAWGVRVPQQSRLHKARQVLREAAVTGMLVPTHRGDVLGLRSLELALDFVAIAETLPAVPIAAMRRELRDCLVGEIDPPEALRGPLQLQSQAVVRAAFVHAGLSPIHPTHSSRHGLPSPDLLLENGLSRYGVESKRPQSARTVLARFLDGCAQLSGFGVSGAVLVDVSDCVRDLDDQAAGARVYELGGALAEEVFEEGSGHRDGYAHVMVVGTYARVAWTSVDHADHALANVRLASRILVLAQARNTLADHRAKWIRQTFEIGLRALTDPLTSRGAA